MAAGREASQTDTDTADAVDVTPVDDECFILSVAVPKTPVKHFLVVVRTFVFVVDAYGMVINFARGYRSHCSPVWEACA